MNPNQIKSYFFKLPKVKRSHTMKTWIKLDIEVILLGIEADRSLRNSQKSPQVSGLK